MCKQTTLRQVTVYSWQCPVCGQTQVSVQRPRKLECRRHRIARQHRYAPDTLAREVWEEGMVGSHHLG
jgi:hypothetical protein